VGNEENEYPVPDSNRMMINMTNDLNDVCKEFLKEEIKNELFEILRRSFKRRLKSIQKMTSKNIKTSQIKILRRHRNN
jgi:hypothetical protein